MEKSWLASLEAGAVWVARNDHRLAVKESHSPKPPLNINRLYMEFN